jgi:hypothetical protein
VPLEAETLTNVLLPVKPLQRGHRHSTSREGNFNTPLTWKATAKCATSASTGGNCNYTLLPRQPLQTRHSASAGGNCNYTLLLGKPLSGELGIKEETELGQETAVPLSAEFENTVLLSGNHFQVILVGYPRKGSTNRRACPPPSEIVTELLFPGEPLQGANSIKEEDRVGQPTAVPLLAEKL